MSIDRERCEGLYLKFSEPLMEPHTPVIIERVNGDCTVSQFIIARDEAHELINQLCEFLRVGSPRKVGEDEAQTFEQWWQAEGARMVRTTHCTGYELMKEAWNAALPRAKEQQKELRVKSHTPSVSVL